MRGEGAKKIARTYSPPLTGTVRGTISGTEAGVSRGGFTSKDGVMFTSKLTVTC